MFVQFVLLLSYLFGHCIESCAVSATDVFLHAIVWPLLLPLFL